MKKLFFLLILCSAVFFVPVQAAENTGSSAADTSASKENAASSASGTASKETITPSTADTVTSSEEENPIPAGSTVFKIDNKHIYNGMDTSWQNGYMPTVSNGTASIILPLTTSRSLKNDQLTADLNLGESAASPFVYKNYQKTISLSSQKAKTSSGKETKQTLYYVRFDLPLSDSRINGTYPVIISVTAEDSAGNEVTGSFTVHVTIGDGKATETEAPEESAVSEAETKPSSQPVVLISSHTCEPEAPKAGEEFQITVHLTNTSKTKSVQNMVITVNCDSPELTLLNDTSTIYIEKLKKGASVDIPLKYKASKNTSDGQYTINLSMSYDNENAETLSSSGSILIPVKQPLSVQMNMSSVAASVTAGDTIALNFQFLNLGRSKAYNVRCEVSGEGLLPMNTAFAGNLEPGTSGEASMNIFVGSKQQPGSAASESSGTTSFYGPTTGTVTLRYEDADGNEYTDITSFYTNIQQPLIQSSADSSSETEKAAVQQKAIQWWIALLAGGGIFAAAGVIFFIRKRKTAAKRTFHETFDKDD